MRTVLLIVVALVVVLFGSVVLYDTARKNNHDEEQLSATSCTWSRYCKTPTPGPTPTKIATKTPTKAVTTVATKTPTGVIPKTATTTPTKVATVAPTKTTTPVVTPAPTDARGCLDIPERAFLTLINDYRVANGLQPLKASYALTVASYDHSLDMATRNFFSHTNPDGATFDQRIRAAGYTYNTTIGENIAAGFNSAQAAFDAWKASPGHNANMLNPKYTVIGLGRAMLIGSKYTHYWTTDFGGYVDSPPGC